jgi:hypothetical protein
MMLPHMAVDLRQAMAGAECALYSNLVTRATGRAVRTQLELLLGEISGHRLAVLDFSNVGVLDFSCADEIVAQLLLRAGAGHRETPLSESASFFLLRGLTEAHREALEPVLERHQLALVYETEHGTLAVLGAQDDSERAVWQAVVTSGGGTASALALTLDDTADRVTASLQTLARRRLLVPIGEEFHPVRVA